MSGILEIHRIDVYDMVVVRDVVSGGVSGGVSGVVSGVVVRDVVVRDGCRKILFFEVCMLLASSSR